MTASPAIGAPAPVWDIEGVADFNGGGQPDILWRHSSTGSAVIWQMNGTTKQSDALIGAPDLSWQVARLGDYNGGAQADILWHRPSTGTAAIWQMNGLVRELAEVIGAPVGWTPQ